QYGALPAELTSIPDHDWAGFARAFGAQGFTVREPAELASTFEKALAAAGRDAVAWVVTKQREIGIDVISNGEQQRESFVLYLLRRIGCIGDQGDRAQFADIESCPKFKEERARENAARQAVSNVAFLPKCTGPITYIGKAELDAECAALKAADEASGRGAVA